MRVALFVVRDAGRRGRAGGAPRLWRLAGVPSPCSRMGSAMLVPTVMRGFSDDKASWNTIWMRRRISRFWRSGAWVKSTPPIRTCPQSGFEQRQDKARQGRLAASALADKAQRFAPPKREADLRHGLDARALRPPGPEGFRQLVDFEQRVRQEPTPVQPGCRRPRGSPKRPQRLVLPPAHVPHGGATGREAASFRRMPQVRRTAADRLRAERCDRPRSRPRRPAAPCVGMARVVEQGVDVGAFDDTARIHDQHLVGHRGHDAEIVGDQQKRGAHVDLQVVQKAQDLGLYGDVERRRRLVGDDDAGGAAERGRNEYALPHPAAEMVRVVMDAAAGSATPTRVSSSTAFRSASTRDIGWWACRVSVICWPMVSAGLSEVSGSWKIMPIRAPRTCSMLPFAECEQIPSVELHGSCDDATGRFDEPHQRKRRGRFSAAQFPDQRGRTTRPSG